MPSMPTYHVNKGSQFGFLDATLGGANFDAEYGAALGRLQGADPAAVLNAAASARIAPNRLTQNDFNHFVQDWLGGGGWWPQNAVPETLRAGFTKAIEHARARQLPIEVLWVCAQDPDFHLYYCEGPRQVTVLIFTPRPRGHTDLPLNHSESIWVVKLREPSDDQYPSLGTGIPPRRWSRPFRSERQPRTSFNSSCFTPLELCLTSGTPTSSYRYPAPHNRARQHCLHRCIDSAGSAVTCALSR